MFMYEIHTRNTSYRYNFPMLWTYISVTLHRYECEKFGGQCECKPNVIGRQCTRCKPEFFGFPDCKQCNCPPTATCNEETGNVIINRYN